MTDWKTVATARGIGIPSQDLDRTVAPLEPLEKIFVELAKKLGPEAEPASVYQAEESE